VAERFCPNADIPSDRVSPKLIRLFRLAEILRTSRGPLTIDELRNELTDKGERGRCGALCPRTVRRDLTLLSIIGCATYYRGDSSRPARWQWRGGWLFSNLNH
jgi:predicted DNA-binding transcriptional regulator YafY